MNRVKYNFDFLAGVYLDNHLQFNHYQLELEMFTNTQSVADQNTAFERITYFLKDIVQKSVFIDENDYDNIIKLSNSDIPLLTVPSPGPFDQLLQAILVTKINAIMEDVMIVYHSEISSVLGMGMKYLYDVDFDNEDIGDTEEVSELIDFDNQLCWWNCAEPRFVTLLNNEELNEFIPYDNWKDLGLDWAENYEDSLEPEFTPEVAPINNGSNIVHIRDFNKND